MKGITSIIVCFVSVLFISLIQSCAGKEEISKPLWQAYEMMGTDTINKVDSTGLKQGAWYFFADKGKKAKPNEKPKLLVKGLYTDDKREGTWYYYSIDGTPSDTVVYHLDFPVDQ